VAVKYEKIVEEDLNLGVGAVDVTMPGGGTALGHRIGVQTFLSLDTIVFMDGGQNIIGGAAAAIVQLDEEELDTMEWFDVATYKFTPTVLGTYLIDAYLKLAGFTGVAIVSIYKNEVLVVSTEMVRAAITGQVTLSAKVKLNGTTDYVTLRVSHNDGVNNREVLVARMSMSLTGKVVV
jgi:hypothetical protein